MRLLLVNPNTTSSMTDSMLEVAGAISSSTTEIIPLTATKGVPYISSRAEAQIAGAIVLEMIAEQKNEIDAVVIAAFGDPGLLAAREQFNLPIVGMAQASLLSACLLGERISIVTFTPLMSRWYLDSVKASAVEKFFVGVRTPSMEKLNAFAEQASMETELRKLVNLSIEEDGADVVILGGAPLAGMAPRMQSQVNCILLDPISCAVSMAESLVKLSDKSAFANRHSRPASKESIGLSDTLAQALKES